MVLDSILNDRVYVSFEPELIADWRAHYGSKFARMKDNAVAALRRALENLRSRDPDAAAELEELEQRLGPSA
jgi:phosphate uptake regulator